MSKVVRFEDLDCWKEARILVRQVYESTGKREFLRDINLVNQLRRAAISVMANIAEGFFRKSDKEFVHYLYIGLSSAAEVQSHLYVALDQNYIGEEEFHFLFEQAENTAKRISGFIKYLRK